MGNISAAFSYSIGRKLIMGLTGIFLITFLPVHLAGNLLLFKGPTAFNEYSEFMGHNPIIRTMEIVLFAGFLFHIVDGLWLAYRNRKARPVRYAVNGGSKSASLFSRIMPHTGIIVLVFLILHLVSFFVRARFGVDVPYEGIDPTLYDNAWNAANAESLGLHAGDSYSPYHKTVAVFSVAWYAIFYVVAMAVIGFHLLHGFQSAFQTLGIRHKKYTPIIRIVGLGYAILIPAAFAAIPLYFLIKSVA
jgi:succinate dehydrogenase / fumarate reductase, cytochrome b subunit